MQAVFNIFAWCYPLVLHLCIYLDRLDIAVFYLALLLTWPTVVRLLGLQRPGLPELLGVLLAAALITVLRTHELIAFKLLPVLIHTALFVLFSASLRRGRTPVITRLAFLMQTSVSAEELVYTRHVTLLWAAVFLFMGALSAIFAIYASTELWSWFVNIVSYVIIASVFLAEFMVRHRVLSGGGDYNLILFLKNLVRINPRRAILRADTDRVTSPEAPEKLEAPAD